MCTVVFQIELSIEHGLYYQECSTNLINPHLNQLAFTLLN